MGGSHVAQVSDFGSHAWDTGELFLPRGFSIFAILDLWLSDLRDFVNLSIYQRIFHLANTEAGRR